MLKRSGHWWEYIVLQTFGSQEWLESFHISKDAINYLCVQLIPHLQYQDTHLQKAVSVKKCVASAEYRTVSHLFGVG